MCQLEIRGQMKHLIDVDENQTINAVKEKIAQLELIPVSLLMLFSGGTPLSDDMMVGDLLNPSLDVIVPLLGGKVHGSLARAGKVKGQTPKVDKQDKKKKKTGRAKRRMQYNRRFVNVIQTFGRKRGPNSKPN